MFLIKSIFIIFLAFVLFILLIAAMFAFRFWGMIKSVMNGGRQNNAQSANNSYEGKQSESTTSSTTQGKKIFGPNEGEYVEFEEVP